MNSLSLVLLATSLALSAACTHQHNYAPYPSQLKGPATVFLKDGRRYRQGRGVVVNNDPRTGHASTVVVPFAAPEERSVAIEDVDRIETQDRTAGMLIGGVAGGVAGAIAALGVVSGTNETGGTDRSGTEVGSAALIGLGVGAGLGMILGHAMGVRHIYRPNSKRPALVAGPSNRGVQLGLVGRF